MGRQQIEKFANAVVRFRCPLCAAPLTFDRGALRCAGAGHTFNVSAKGTVNFIANQRPLKGYDRPFFENRRVFMAAGFYAHVFETVAARLADERSLARLVDAGCGEGYYARGLQQALRCETVGFDLAKEAVAVASSGGGPVLWCVADLANIPLADASVDCVLNVFTPANYAEFARVLVPGGLVAKVVPGPRHLEELRAALHGHVRSDSYENDDVVSYFERHFDAFERVPCTATRPLDDAWRATLLRMTPLAFGVDPAVLERLHLDAITIDAELLVGRTRMC